VLSLHRLQLNISIACADKCTGLSSYLSESDASLSLRPYAKPLAVMTSKWLLHHSPCTSPLSDFAPGSFFRRVIREGHSGDNMRSPLSKNKKKKTEAGTEAAGAETFALVPPTQIRKVIFCSGKVFYHLYHARRAAGIRDTSFVRLEQIAPFPYDMVAKAIQEYPNAELVWVQEEPRNMGAWSYIKPRFDSTVKAKKFPHKPIR
jgi:2-oxoglutarate dehydrogenase E1 component